VANLRDVAAQAGVSVSIASRLLNRDPTVRTSKETRDRVLRVADELSYRPNHAGRALRTARSNTIALVVPVLTNSVFAELVRGVEDGALEHGYTLLLARSEQVHPGGEVMRRLTGEGRVDGFLLQARDDLDEQALDPIAQAGAPVVLVHSSSRHLPGSVVLDDVEGARLATDHLIALGHERIAMVNGLRQLNSAQRRERGYRAALKAAGLRGTSGYVRYPGYQPADARPALRALMELRQPPTAVFVANINAALGVLAEARALGLDVPRDLSVCAFLDSDVAEFVWPPVTTVRMPLYAMGRQAVVDLHARLNGEPARDFVVRDPAPELVVRASTAAAPKTRG
jgi:LacI family transcriptional regulator